MKAIITTSVGICPTKAVLVLMPNSNASPIHAMMAASMPTCSRFERPPSHQALWPDFISFMPPFHISNTNSLIKLPISHCLSLVQVDKSVLTYVPFIHTPTA